MTQLRDYMAIRQGHLVLRALGLIALSWSIEAQALSALIRPPADSWRFKPSSLAVAGDGSIYVAEGVAGTVQAYDVNGSFQFSIENPANNFTPGLTGSLQVPSTSLAADNSGGVTIATYFGSTTRVASYDSSGSLLFETSVEGTRRPSVAIGIDDRPYVSTGRKVYRFAETGAATLAYEPSRFLEAIDFDSTGRLFGLTSYAEVLAFDNDGTVADSFSVDQRLIRDETITSFAIANDLVYVTDNRSGTTRSFTRSGEPAGVGYGVPLTTDLTASPDGRLFAAMPDARVVERIGPERFEPGYSGVNRLGDRPAIFPDFYDRLIENGVDLDDGWTETTAPTFIVPGTAGEMVDLDFHYVARGPSNVVFVYDVNQVEADSISDPGSYFVEAIDAMVGFAAADQRPRCHLVGSCDEVEEPNLLTTLSIVAGTEIGFLDYSGFWRSSVAADPFSYELLLNRARGPFQGFEGVDDPDYIDFVTQTLERRTTGAWLLSSDSRANWGRMDQFVSFLSDGETLIGVEDLNLAGESDAEFTDFMFRISTRLIPTPEPSAAVLSLLSLQLFAVLRNRRR